MSNRTTTAMISLILVLSAISTVWAMPRPGGIVIVAKDGSGDYDCIQAAIDDYSSTEILIMPGQYTENILITKDLTIRAYDGPLTTILDGSQKKRWTKGHGSPATKQDDVIAVNSSVSLFLNGLCVTNGQDGIEIQESDNVTLQNCVFWSNEQHGIYITDNWTTNKQPSVLIYNCIAIANGASGVCIGQRHYDVCPPVTIRNSIFVANAAYGITLARQFGAVSEPWRISLDYNCYAANMLGNLGYGIGVGKPISEGQHSFSQSPYFVNGNDGDFRLTPWSPCVDAGTPGSGYMDPDGTTNNVGAYGGPGAVTFFESPIDGPMVREVTITPGAVVQGNTLTIRAIGSVR